MPHPAHDYSSSDEDKPRQSTSRHDDYTGQSASASLSPSKARNAEGQRVKLTLRPSINHLMNDPSSGPSYSAPEPRVTSPRSSLSPPPPITLKLGLHNRTTMAERMAYSSDEDGQPPTEKPKSSRSSNKSHASPRRRKGSSAHLRPMDEPTLPAQHRKSYDWLQPSAAGASHHGPPERPQERYTVTDDYSEHRTRRLSDAREEAARYMGWKNDEDMRSSLQPSPERGELDANGQLYVQPVRPKRSHKKKLVEGPGKAWRKGLKKGMPVPWIEGGTFMPNGSIQVAADAYQPSYPGDMTPGSAGSPEPEPQSRQYAVHPAQHQYNDTTPRGSPPLFVLADPQALGFPVYSKPIVTPKLTLSNFPKVTTFFWPNNGGDVGPFPRKEPVRPWKPAERTYVGVGGGQLKFKTWNKGPTSHLSQLIQADKEADKSARDTQRREAKAAAALSSIPASDLPPGVATWAESRHGPGAGSAESTPAPSISAIESLLPGPEEEATSEVGEADAEALPVDKPAPKKRKAAPRASGGKAKLKKSKLGQEITVENPITSTSAIEELM